MAKFASPARQSASVIKQMQGGALASVGTVRNYEQALTRVAEYRKERKLGTLRSLTPKEASIYLNFRAKEVGQKSLDMERQAIQAMMLHVTGKLEQGERLAVERSEIEQHLNARAYLPNQVNAIAQSQTEKHALATKIAHSAGLRAHELLTLLPIEQREIDQRPALDTKFLGREGVKYSVQGKGGLIREVVIPTHLSQQLEKLRHNQPINISDRNVRYTQYYNISGGQRWSNSFSAASKRTLGWSEGAHGVRHSYAQERMRELMRAGFNRETSLTTVSQEMGHFRPEITEVYLR